MKVALGLSLVIHMLAGAFAVRFWQLSRLTLPPPEIVTQSSAIRLEHRVAPLVHPLSRPRRREKSPRTESAKIAVPRLRRSRPPLELFKQAAVAESIPSPAPRPAGKSAHEAAHASERTYQSVDYAKTIAEAKAAQNPLNVATPPAVEQKPFKIDFQGSSGSTSSFYGYMTPIKSWKLDGYNYYYVHILLIFSDGSRDETNVPWPIHYRPSDDPLARHDPRPFPLPSPMPAYALPQSALPLPSELRIYFPQVYPNG